MSVFAFRDLYSRSQQNPAWAGASEEDVARVASMYDPSAAQWLDTQSSLPKRLAYKFSEGLYDLAGAVGLNDIGAAVGGGIGRMSDEYLGTNISEQAEQIGREMPADIAAMAPLALGGPTGLIAAGATMGANALGKTGNYGSAALTAAIPGIMRFTSPLGADIATKTFGTTAGTIGDTLAAFAGSQIATAAVGTGVDIIDATVMQGNNLEDVLNKDFLALSVLGNVPFAGLDVMGLPKLRKQRIHQALDRIATETPVGEKLDAPLEIGQPKELENVAAREPKQTKLRPIGFDEEIDTERFEPIYSFKDKKVPKGAEIHLTTPEDMVAVGHLEKKLKVDRQAARMFVKGMKDEGVEFPKLSEGGGKQITEMVGKRWTDTRERPTIPGEVSLRAMTAGLDVETAAMVRAKYQAREKAYDIETIKQNFPTVWRERQRAWLKSYRTKLQSAKPKNRLELEQQLTTVIKTGKTIYGDNPQQRAEQNGYRNETDATLRELERAKILEEQELAASTPRTVIESGPVIRQGTDEPTMTRLAQEQEATQAILKTLEERINEDIQRRANRKMTPAEVKQERVLLLQDNTPEGKRRLAQITAEHKRAKFEAEQAALVARNTAKVKGPAKPEPAKAEPTKTTVGEDRISEFKRGILWGIDNGVIPQDRADVLMKFLTLAEKPGNESAAHEFIVRVGRRVDGNDPRTKLTFQDEPAELQKKLQNSWDGALKQAKKEREGKVEKSKKQDPRTVKARERHAEKTKLIKETVEASKHKQLIERQRKAEQDLLRFYQEHVGDAMFDERVDNIIMKKYNHWLTSDTKASLMSYLIKTLPDIRRQLARNRRGDVGLDPTIMDRTIDGSEMDGYDEHGNLPDGDWKEMFNLGRILPKQANLLLGFLQPDVMVGEDGNVVRMGGTDVGKSGLVNEQRLIKTTGLSKNVWEALKGFYPEAWSGDKVDVNKLMKGVEERPFYETHVYGQDGVISKNKIELDQLTHEWLDNLPTNVRSNFLAFGEGFELLPDEHPDKIKSLRYYELSRLVADERSADSPQATGYYNQISPFDTTKYPVVRVDVAVPLNKIRIGGEWRVNIDNVGHYWTQDNLHENLPNTLGWAMVQFVPDSRTGETVAFVGEQQSQWQQKRYANTPKNAVKITGQGWDVVFNDEDIKQYFVSIDKAKTANEALAVAQKEHTDVNFPPHALLELQHKLVLREVIKEARKRGVSKVVISDGESAMMTEKLDIVRSVQKWRDTPENRQVLDRQGVAYTTNPQGYLIPRPKQEGGMRLHYDTRLPDSMRKLTGDAGRPWDGGVHKNAVEWDEVASRRQQETVMRQGSPVFRNRDGTPKSSVTGRIYDIRATESKFNTGTDRFEYSVIDSPDTPTLLTNLLRRHGQDTPSARALLEPALRVGRLIQNFTRLKVGELLTQLSTTDGRQFLGVARMSATANEVYVRAAQGVMSPTRRANILAFTTGHELFHIFDNQGKLGQLPEELQGLYTQFRSDIEGATLADRQALMKTFIDEYLPASMRKDPQVVGTVMREQNLMDTDEFVANTNAMMALKMMKGGFADSLRWLPDSIRDFFYRAVETGRDIYNSIRGLFAIYPGESLDNARTISDRYRKLARQLAKQERDLQMGESVVSKLSPGAWVDTRVQQHMFGEGEAAALWFGDREKSGVFGKMFDKIQHGFMPFLSHVIQNPERFIYVGAVHRESRNIASMISKARSFHYKDENGVHLDNPPIDQIRKSPKLQLAYGKLQRALNINRGKSVNDLLTDPELPLHQDMVELFASLDDGEKQILTKHVNNSRKVTRFVNESFVKTAWTKAGYQIGKLMMHRELAKTPDEAVELGGKIISEVRQLDDDTFGAWAEQFVLTYGEASAPMVKVVNEVRKQVKKYEAFVNRDNWDHYITEKRQGEWLVQFVTEDGNTGAWSFDSAEQAMAAYKNPNGYKNSEAKYTVKTAFKPWNTRSRPLKKIRESEMSMLLDQAKQKREELVGMIEDELGIDPNVAQVFGEQFEGFITDIQRATNAQNILNTSVSRKHKPGREDLDFIEQQKNWVDGVALMLARGETDVFATLTDADPALKSEDGVAFKKALYQQIENIRTADTETGRFITRLAFVWRMGLNMSSHIVEAVSWPMILAPVLQMRGAGLAESFRLPAKAMNYAYRYVLGDLGGKGKSSYEKLFHNDPARGREVDALVKRAQDEHVLHTGEHLDPGDDDLILHTHTDREISHGGKTAQAAKAVSSSASLVWRFMAKVYQPFTRANAHINLIALYDFSKKQLMEQGYKGQELIDKAQNEAMVWADVANGSAGKAGRPTGLFSGKHFNRTMGMSMYSLQSFSLAHFFNNLAYMGKAIDGQTDPVQRANYKRAAATSLSLHAAAAGMFGLVPIGIMAALAREVFGFDIEKETREWLASDGDPASNSILADLAFHGLPYAAGVTPNFEAKYQPGGPAGLNAYNGWSPQGMLGAIGGFYNDFDKATNAAAEQGPMAAFSHLLPTSVKKVMNLISNNGQLVDRAGNPVYTPNTIEKATIALGFEPTNYTKRRRAASAGEDIRSATARENQRLYAEFADMAIKGQSPRVVKQKIRAIARDEDHYKEIVRSVAETATKKLYGVDPTDRATSQTAERIARLNAAYGIEPSQPTAKARASYKYQLTSSLGVESDYGKVGEGALIDQLRRSNPYMTSMEARQLVRRLSQRPGL